MSVCNCRWLCLHNSNGFQNTCQDKKSQKSWQAAWPEFFFLTDHSKNVQLLGSLKVESGCAHKDKHVKRMWPTILVPKCMKSLRGFSKGSMFRMSSHFVVLRIFKSIELVGQCSPWASTSRFGVIWRAWWPTLGPFRQYPNPQRSCHCLWDTAKTHNTAEPNPTEPNTCCRSCWTCARWIWRGWTRRVGAKVKWWGKQRHYKPKTGKSKLRSVPQIESQLEHWPPHSNFCFWDSGEPQK